MTNTAKISVVTFEDGTTHNLWKHPNWGPVASLLRKTDRRGQRALVTHAIAADAGHGEIVKVVREFHVREGVGGGASGVFIDQK